MSSPLLDNTIKGIDMNKFSDFSEVKQIATFLVDNEIDVDAFCEMVLKLAENDNLTEAALYNEFMMGRGIAAAARGLAGVGNLAAAPARWGAKKVGQAGQAVGNAAMSAGRAGMNAVNQAGQAVGNAAMSAGKAGMNAVNQAGQAVGKGVMDAGRAVNSTMEHGRRQQAIKQGYDRIKMLYDSLEALGIPRANVSGPMGTIQMMLQTQQNKLNKTLGKPDEPTIPYRSNRFS
jgi:hypothetical protein